MSGTAAYFKFMFNLNSHTYSPTTVRQLWYYLAYKTKFSCIKQDITDSVV